MLFLYSKTGGDFMWLWIFLFGLFMLPITAFVIGISIIILLQCVKYGLNKGGDRDG